MTVAIRIPVLTAPELHYLEACIGCAACAASCPYFYVSEEYSPVDKAEAARRILRTKYTFAGRILGSLVGAKRPSEKDLDRLLDIAYRCTGCGSCYETCTVGIYSGGLVFRLREMLTSVNRAPALLQKLSEMEASGGYYEAFKEEWQKLVEEAGRLGVKVGAKAEVLLMVTGADLLVGFETVVNALKVLKRLGVDVAIPDRPLGIRPPISYFIGDSSSVKKVLEDIVGYIEKLSPKTVALLDGSHVYKYLRFEASAILGRKPSFEVKHIVELLYEYAKAGVLKLSKVGEKVTWHDPCYLSRWGGVREEPRTLLAGAAEFVEAPKKYGEVSCTGGGGGVAMLHGKQFELYNSIARVDPSQQGEFLKRLSADFERAVSRRINELKATGAKTVVAACWDCIYSINTGAQLSGVELRAIHIVDFIAKALGIS